MSRRPIKLFGDEMSALILLVFMGLLFIGGIAIFGISRETRTHVTSAPARALPPPLQTICQHGDRLVIENRGASKFWFIKNDPTCPGG